MLVYVDSPIYRQCWPENRQCSTYAEGAENALPSDLGWTGWIHSLAGLAGRQHGVGTANRQPPLSLGGLHTGASTMICKYTSIIDVSR